ncbi:actin polymerization bzz1 [Fusarium longipes]|uniref:Actin polymerization bzz1 n=1 Tax=Fusarium longipes TaxID=694270 RepID=A0A395STQ0_9HYPO|nr:actin polymerization bzz1 [Fusarium longipes]
MAPSVYILLQRDTESTVTISSVYLDLQDANAALLHLAQEAGVDPATAKPTAAAGSEQPSLVKEPLRWEAADGTAAWVERHTVASRKTHTTGSPGAADKPGLKRNDSRLYVNDDDDIIEVTDYDGHYD